MNLENIKPVMKDHTFCMITLMSRIGKSMNRGDFWRSTIKLCAPNAVGPGSILDWGTKIPYATTKPHILTTEPRNMKPRAAQLRSPRASVKTQSIKKKTKKQKQRWLEVAKGLRV